MPYRHGAEKVTARPNRPSSEGEEEIAQLSGGRNATAAAAAVLHGQQQV
jgi:hypothetical protein